MAILPGVAADDARERTEVPDRRTLLRLIACGSVGHGKSTLLGQLREQGTTIDVARGFFSTARRRFIVADAPWDEQHIRNMVTGASVADLAVVLVDARKGLLTQT